MGSIKFLPIPAEQYNALEIDASTILEVFINNENCLVIRPLSDTDNYVCDGDCEGCPVRDDDCDGNCESCSCCYFCEDSECCPCCGMPLNEEKGG